MSTMQLVRRGSQCLQCQSPRTWTRQASAAAGQKGQSLLAEVEYRSRRLSQTQWMMTARRSRRAMVRSAGSYRPKRLVPVFAPVVPPKGIAGAGRAEGARRLGPCPTEAEPARGFGCRRGRSEETTTTVEPEPNAPPAAPVPPNGLDDVPPKIPPDAAGWGVAPPKIPPVAGLLALPIDRHRRCHPHQKRP